MSEIKAIDKLRECANHENAGFFVNLEQAFELSRYKCGDSTVKPDGGMILNAIADAIESEIAERYMLLPVDADGVPIHLYDKLLKSTGAAKPSYGEVVGVSDDSVFFNAKQGWGSNWSKLTRHVKTRTLEDVIEGAINAAFGNEAPFGVIAKKAADEIRELFGGDES